MQKTLKKAIKLLIFLSLSCGITAAFAQSSGLPDDPVIKAKRERADLISLESSKFFYQKKWVETIERGSAATAIHRELGSWPGSHLYGNMAWSYLKLGDIVNANNSFKEMTRLVDPPRGMEFSQDIHVIDMFTVAYIEFLALQGRENDAKAVYYALMRFLSKSTEKVSMGAEPFPFLVVFDEDANGDYWEYTPERMILATKMAVMSKLSSSYFDLETLTTKKHPELVEQAKSAFPGWYYPYAMQAIDEFYEVDEAKVVEALYKARNQRERDWINHGVAWFRASSVERAVPGFIHEIDCRAEQRKIRLLETSRIALMENYNTVSCGKWGSKF